MYKCDLCAKSFKKKQGLDYHLLKKVCQRQKNTCHYCGKSFSNQTGYIYHMNNFVCQIKLKPKIKLKLTNIDQQIKQLEEKIGLLKEENNLLKGENRALKENPQTVNKIDKQQINVIFPQAFGNEELNYILSKVPDLLHDAFTKHVGRSIEYITEKIHCNKEVFPEYTNVYIRGYKSPFALVSDGNKFQHKPQKRIIDQIIEKCRSMLQEYADDNGEKYGQKIIDKYERYMSLVDMDGRDKENGHGKKNMYNAKKSERRKDLELEIAGLLLDMRSVIESDPNVQMMLNKLEDGEFTQTDEQS